jgi:SPP1 family predicted phage head-tail adaptor
MNPGTLNNYISIQSSTGSTNENGFPVPAWKDFKKLWASKQGLIGRSFYAAQAVQSESDITYMTRYTKGIKAGMKVIDGDDTYYIKVDPVDKDGKKTTLYLICNDVKPSTGGVNNGS